ncbi:MAG TPA: FAD-dependent oxidoreductase [Methylomirabilota bacterium]|jgi:ferredoxin-NADP reductase
MEKARECRARVTALRALTPDILEADLAMVEPPALAFDAGQWISVPFGPKTVRAYSIASSPRTPATLTLCADVAPAGIGSRWFRALAPGAEVGFKGPLGGFVLEPGDARRLLLVAEEIGIVPIRAMLHELAAGGVARPATLVYWARDAGWLAYDAELRGLARQHARFAYHPVTPSDGAPAAVADRLVDDVTGLVAYVAGGEATIKAVRAALMAKGMERKAVKWEKFW